MRRSLMRLSILFAVVVASLAIAIAAGVSGAATSRTKSNRRMPDVLGLSVRSAKTRIASAAGSARVKVRTETVRFAFPRGGVVAQVPVAGAGLIPGRRIILMVSHGGSSR